MRTYLIDNEKNELVMDLRRTTFHTSELVEFSFSTLEDRKFINEEKVFIRKLAGSLFASEDGIKWSKLAKQDLPNQMLNVERVFDVYRGFKPSGLSGANDGELLTQMPGKIVKVIVSVGDKVTKGQTLLILEAMKMENEIKCGGDGVVKAIHVSVGDTLDSGVLMLEIEA